MGAEAVIEKIIKRASDEAERIKSEGKAAADKKAAEAAAVTAAEKESILARGRAEADAVRYREKLKAELDVRKNTLGAKRQLLDAVYTEAEKKLAAMPDGEKAKLYASFVDSCGMEGELKAYASSDMRAFVESNAAQWGASYAGELKGNGRVLLSGETCDADLSYDRIIADLREKTEADAAKILFA